MKTAKVIIQTITLNCPECGRRITEENPGGMGLIHKNDISDRWKFLQERSWQCPAPSCRKWFKLPTNPFREEKVPDA